MGKQRITLMLDEEPARLLEELASGPRKKSELVATLLIQAAANAESLAADPLTRIEQRLLRIERNMEQILNRLG